MSNEGIRSLIPVETVDEYNEKMDARSAVMKRINATPTPLPAARIAEQPLVSFTPEFYKNPEPKLSKEEVEKKKFDRHMEKEYGHDAIKKDILKQIYQNKKAGKDPYHDMSQSTIMVAEIIKDKAQNELKKFKAKENPSIMQQAINYSPKKIPLKVQQKMKKILPINVDPDHPDGFTFVKDQDTYETYKDDPSRYTQELAYKYDGIPVKDTVKPYDALDKSSFPSNPIQQAALRSFGKAYDRLTPLQKTQIANAQKKKKQKENPKLFESIIDNLGKKK